MGGVRVRCADESSGLSEPLLRIHTQLTIPATHARPSPSREVSPLIQRRQLVYEL